MKRSTPLILLSVLLATSSCDKIETPVLENPNGTGDVLQWELCPDLIPSEYVFPLFPNNESTLNTVLLEDYTGHTCTACPGAAIIAAELEEANPSRVFVASVHAGVGNGFQQVSDDYPTDFTTEAGDTYVNEIDPQLFGNPAGTVNRIGGGPTGGIWYLPSQWESLVNDELLGSTQVNISLNYFHCPEGNGLFVHSAVELEGQIIDPSDFRLIIYLLREKVISPQSSGGTYIPDYEHHNTLSGNINGTWGTSLALDTLEINEAILHNFSYQLPDPLIDSTYQADNLALLAYVMDRNSQRVYQSHYIELE